MHTPCHSSSRGSLFLANVSCAMASYNYTSQHSTSKPRVASLCSSSSGPTLQTWGNCNTTLEMAVECTNMQTDYYPQVKNELVQYRTLDPRASDGDPPQWWVIHHRGFPMISDVAPRILRRSASLASDERSFCTAGLTIMKMTLLTEDSLVRILSVRGGIVSGLLVCRRAAVNESST